MISFNLQFFGGRGSGGGNKVSANASRTAIKATPGISKSGQATNVGMSNLPVGSVVEATIKKAVGKGTRKVTLELTPSGWTDGQGWNFKNNVSDITKNLWEMSGVSNLQVVRHGILSEIRIGDRTWRVNADGTQTEIKRRSKRK